MSKDPNLATMEQLETVYNTLAVYNFIEMLEFKDEMESIALDDSKAQREQLKQEQANKARRGNR